MALSRRTRTIEADGSRRMIHPTEVRGFWNRRKSILQAALIVFFLLLPWLKIGGKPLLLLDIVNRRFSVFGVLFRAHDVPMVFLAAFGFILAFGLLTALFGRVWCGWACPQTVFIEAVFRRIERWCEGPAEARRARENTPMTADLAFRRGLKWALFAAVSAVITHSFLALFVGPEVLREMIVAGPTESPIAFLFIVISTLVILFDFGWFREQFCIVVCPYGRIQSLFQDTKSLTIAYDARRGEPRGAIRAKSQMPSGAAPMGDCVDCFRCVRVCPTGIDIRDGSSQLECIACTACIDACDDVMARLKRPLGLIRYASVEELADPNAARRRVSHFFRGRTLVYGVLLIAVAVAAIGIARGRGLAMVEIFKTRGAPFTLLTDAADGAPYANLFFIEISNQGEESLRVHFDLEHAGPELRLVMPNNPISIPPGELLRQPLTIRFEKSILTRGRAEAEVLIDIRTEGSGHEPRTETEEKKVTLVGPF